MSWTPNAKEVEAINFLEAAKRYEYLLKKVADQGEIWSLLKDGGWALAGDDQGRQLVPVWPHSRYAEICAEGVWADYEPKSIPIDVWLSRWVSGMERDDRQIAAFPTPTDKGIPVTPIRFKADLEEALSQYE